MLTSRHHRVSDGADTWPVWFGVERKGPSGSRYWEWLSGASWGWEPSGSIISESQRCGYMKEDGTWESTHTCFDTLHYTYVCENEPVGMLVFKQHYF